MSQLDRLLPARIKTPDGKIYDFSYEDLNSSFEKNTSKYRFSDQNGSLIQDFGLAESSYPILIYFTGEDCDITANDFEESAKIKGITILSHPIKGDLNVIIEKADRQDSVKTALNQITFNLSMTETLLTDIPATTTQIKTKLDEKRDALFETNSAAFASDFSASSVSDATKAKNRILNGINNFKKAVSTISKTVNEINNAIDETSAFIENNIDSLLSTPLELAGAMQRLYNAPARANASVNARISGYNDAYHGLLSKIIVNSQDGKNQRAEKSLILNCIIASMGDVYVNPDPEGNGEYSYLTRTDAIKSAQELKTLLLDAQESIDIDEQETTNFKLKYKFTQSYEVASQIRDIVNDSIKVLVSESFELLNEKKIITDRERTIVDVCAELYEDLDRLDFFISSNSLNGEDLIVLPAGKEIKYYV